MLNQDRADLDRRGAGRRDDDRDAGRTGRSVDQGLHRPALRLTVPSAPLSGSPGSYSSAAPDWLLPLSPPATNTRPSARSVAVWLKWRVSGSACSGPCPADRVERLRRRQRRVVDVGSADDQDRRHPASTWRCGRGAACPGAATASMRRSRDRRARRSRARSQPQSRQPCPPTTQERRSAGVSVCDVDHARGGGQVPLAVARQRERWYAEPLAVATRPRQAIPRRQRGLYRRAGGGLVSAAVHPWPPRLQLQVTGRRRRHRRRAPGRPGGAWPWSRPPCGAPTGCQVSVPGSVPRRAAAGHEHRSIAEQRGCVATEQTWSLRRRHGRTVIPTRAAQRAAPRV